MAIYNSLKILNDDEIKELFEIPTIEPKDRELLFEITPEDKVYLDKQTIIANKVNYILQVGYFRAARKFYKFSFVDVQDDVQYILKAHFSNTSHLPDSITKEKHYAAQKNIMAIYKYKRYDASFETNLGRQAKRLSKRDLTPRFIFDELLHYCEQYRIIRPKYSTLQSLVSKAIAREENRLTTKLAVLLDKDSRTILDSLLTKNDTISSLALLKKDPKGLATKEMEAELEKQRNIAHLFEQSKQIIPALSISRQNLQYYAGLCEYYYDTYQFRSFNNKKSRLYMMCFVWQRFIKLNDHLTSYFIHKVSWYINEALFYAKGCVLDAKLDIGQDRKLASKMLKIVNNSTVSDADIRPCCYDIVSKDKFDEFTNKLARPDIDENSYVWAYYTEEHAAIKRNLRAIFLSLNFNLDKNTKIKEAVEFIRDHFHSKEKTKDPVAQGVPLAFIPKQTLKFIVYKKAVSVSPGSKRTKNVKHINIQRYEMAIYKAIVEALGAGNIFVPDSVNYRSLEDELIPLHVWIEDKDKILRDLSDCINTAPIEDILSVLDTELSNLYKHVNKRIKSNENKYIKVDQDKLTWRLPYKKDADSADNPFYEQFKSIGIANIIDFTAGKTNFYDCLTHILNQGSKSRPRPEHIKGYLVSQGEGIGHKKVAESSDVSYQSLIDMEGKFIRVESLVEAGDTIINHIAQLPIFKHYNLSDYGIHASLDGQKLETKYQTILSRYSTKYFGYGKGVVSYSLIANHLPVSTKIIGANEHESHYVLDIVYNNSSDLKISAVSGDMHSVNRVNFGLMHLFGYEFMPRITKINEKADTSLVAFAGTKIFKNDLIKPADTVNTKLIISEWDNIKRIMASLARKDVAQSTIIRKLSSYSKKNRTLKALIEFDRIIMSIYILKYVDDVQLRQRVHRALNRGEAFHQLRKALLQVSGKKILGKSENALEISNQCNRVLACCIIHYNASLLSELLIQSEIAGDEQLASRIKRLSPVAWQHISLHGNFIFSTNEEVVDIKGIIQKLLTNFKDGANASNPYSIRAKGANQDKPVLSG